MHCIYTDFLGALKCLGIDVALMSSIYIICVLSFAYFNRKKK